MIQKSPNLQRITIHLLRIDVLLHQELTKGWQNGLINYWPQRM